jgi:Single-stranded DNA-specific exonuclease
MQLTAEFKKPTIIARLNEEGFLRGSIRGLNDCEFDHFKSYLQGTGMFEYVQGHENAAGCSIHYDNLERFIEKSNKDLAEINFDEDSYGVNFIRNSSDKDLKIIIEELSKYDNIWGSHNEKPLIYIHDINITQNDIQIMGKNQDAVKFQKFGITYVQPYGAQDLIEELQSFGEMKVEIVGEANLNVWNGNTTPQIMIKGYEIKDGSISF